MNTNCLSVNLSRFNSDSLIFKLHVRDFHNDNVNHFIINLVKHICNSNQTSCISILVYLSNFDIDILFERKRDVM